MKTGNSNKLNSFFNTLKTFVTSRIFVINITIAVAAVLLIFLGVFTWLRIYTNHGEVLYVPDFKGLNPQEVAQKAKEKELRFEIIDSVFSAPGKKGTVIDQTPPHNFKVKKNRTIFLTIKAFTPEKVAMPNLKGISIKQAKSDIETYGLQIGRLIYKPDIAKDNVLEQQINGMPVRQGTLIEKGTKIDLILGIGTDTDDFSFVPDLIGLTRYDASLLAAENSLNIGTCLYDSDISSEQDSIDALIWKQMPNPSSVQKPGTQINLWLTLDTAKVKL